MMNIKIKDSFSRIISIVFFICLFQISSFAQKDYVEEIFKTIKNEDPTAFDKLTAYSKSEYKEKYGLDKKFEMRWRHYQRDRYLSFPAFFLKKVDPINLVIDDIVIKNPNPDYPLKQVQVKYHTEEHSCEVNFNIFEIKKDSYRLHFHINKPKCKTVEK